jgi:hypothetical protein
MLKAVASVGVAVIDAPSAFYGKVMHILVIGAEQYIRGLTILSQGKRAAFFIEGK